MKIRGNLSFARSCYIKEKHPSIMMKKYECYQMLHNPYFPLIHEIIRKDAFIAACGGMRKRFFIL